MQLIDLNVLNKAASGGGRRLDKRQRVIITMQDLKSIQLPYKKTQPPMIEMLMCKPNRHVTY